MANVPTSGRAPHIGTLVDLTSPRINVTQGQSKAKSATVSISRIASLDKTRINIFAAIPEKRLRNLLSSSHRAQILRLNGFATMEGDKLTMSPRSPTASNTKSSRASMNLSSRTPSGLNNAIVAQYLEDKAEKTEAENFANNGSINSTPTRAARIKTSPFDKDLPAKPILREADSPERRGIIDATDSASKTLNSNYPPLQPDGNVLESPSDSGSFKVASSLESLADGASGEIELGTAVARENLRANAHIVDIHRHRRSEKTYSLRDELSQSSSAYNNVPGGDSFAARRLADRRAVSVGHIATQADGSPIARNPASTRVNRSSIRGRDALSADGKRRVWESSRDLLYERIREQVDETYMGKPRMVDETTVTSIQQHVAERHNSVENRRQDSSRRSEKYDLGPRVRYTNDAHDVIMGPYLSLPPEGKVPKMKLHLEMPKTGSLKARHRESFIIGSTEGITIPEGPSKVDELAKSRRAAKKAERERYRQAREEAHKCYMEADIPFAPPFRKSSLPSSSEANELLAPRRRDVTCNPSFASRISRPTAASNARAAQSQTSLLQRGKDNFTKKKAAVAASMLKNSSSYDIASSFNNVSTSSVSKTFGASASTTAVPLRKSGTMSSVMRAGKEIKSKIAAMLPGRHREEQPENLTIGHGYASMVSEESIVEKYPLGFRQQNGASRNLKPQEQSGISEAPSATTHPYAEGEFTGEQTDRVNPDRGEDVRERAAAEEYASGARVETNFNRHASVNTHGAGTGPDSNDDPPTPPPTRGLAAGHYAEQEGHDSSGETAMGSYLDRALAEAEHSMDLVIEAARHVQDEGLRAAMTQVIDNLGQAIFSARAARIATIALDQAMGGLVRYTADLGAQASQAAGGAARAA